jgi:hypothetical protein
MPRANVLRGGRQTAVLVHNVDPCKPYKNRHPNALAGELAWAERLGVKVNTPGTAAFDEAIATRRVKWAVLKDGRPVVMPKWVAGQEIKHSVLSGGEPVRAAGEAEIAGSSGHYIGLEIDGGHFFEKGWDARRTVRAHDPVHCRGRAMTVTCCVRSVALRTTACGATGGHTPGRR